MAVLCPHACLTCSRSCSRQAPLPAEFVCGDVLSSALCRHQLNDVAWQPSKLELEAQLGASRERQAELEWRLGSMEGLLRQHAQLLGQGPGQYAPLGSLLDAIDDGHVSPPRRQVCWLASAGGVSAASILLADRSVITGCSHACQVPSIPLSS